MQSINKNNSAKLVKFALMTNRINKFSQKMTLKGYYLGLPNAVHPKTDFITKIMSECSVSFTTARNWVMGVTRPLNPVHVEKLSEMTGIPVDELWNS